MLIIGPEYWNGWPLSQRQLLLRSIKCHCCFCPEPETKESKTVACLTFASDFQIDSVHERTAVQFLRGKQMMGRRVTKQIF